MRKARKAWLLHFPSRNRNYRASTETPKPSGLNPRGSNSRGTAGSSTRMTPHWTSSATGTTQSSTFPSTPSPTPAASSEPSRRIAPQEERQQQPSWSGRAWPKEIPGSVASIWTKWLPKIGRIMMGTDWCDHQGFRISPAWKRRDHASNRSFIAAWSMAFQECSPQRKVKPSEAFFDYFNHFSVSKSDSKIKNGSMVIFRKFANCWYKYILNFSWEKVLELTLFLNVTDMLAKGNHGLSFNNKLLEENKWR